MLLRMVLHVADDGVVGCWGWCRVLLRMVWHVAGMVLHVADDGVVGC